MWKHSRCDNAEGGPQPGPQGTRCICPPNSREESGYVKSMLSRDCENIWHIDQVLCSWRFGKCALPYACRMECPSGRLAEFPERPLQPEKCNKFFVIVHKKPLHVFLYVILGWKFVMLIGKQTSYFSGCSGRSGNSAKRPQGHSILHGYGKAHLPQRQLHKTWSICHINT